MSEHSPTPGIAASGAQSVGDAFPKEQARLRELLAEYRAIGPAGAFGAMMIEQTLREADAAMASGDAVAILLAFTAMQECTG